MKALCTLFYNCAIGNHVAKLRHANGLLTLTAMLFSLTGSCQSWSWVRQTTNSDANIYPMNIRPNPSGGLFVLFQSYGKGILGTFSFSPGFHVAKLNADGELQWLRSIPPSNIIEDKMGGVYIYACISENYSTPGGTITCDNNHRYVIQHLDAQGQFLWASSGNGQLMDLETDESGNGYALINVGDTVVLNSAYSVEPSLKDGKFLLRSFSPDGSLRWTTRGLQQHDTLRFTYGQELEFDRFGHLGVYTKAVLEAKYCQACSHCAIARFTTNGALINYTRGFDHGVKFDSHGLLFDRNNNIYLYTGYYFYDLSKFDSTFSLIERKYLSDSWYMGRSGFHLDNTDNGYLIASYTEPEPGAQVLYDYCGFNASTRGEYNSGIHFLGTDPEKCRAFFSSTGHGNDRITKLCTDNQGNLYGIGYFKHTTASSSYPLSFGSFIMDNPGTHDDLFVFKIAGTETGIPEKQTKHAARLYPNPASKYVRVGGASYGDVISITATNGMFTEERRAGPEGQIDVSGLPAGIYLISTLHHGSIQVGKLVVTAH